MGNEKFVNICKKLVKEYAEEHLDKSDTLPEFEVFVVWSCKTLQNNKALLSTTLFDGMYYELTYNGDKKELYFDAYKKFDETRNIFSKIYDFIELNCKPSRETSLAMTKLEEAQFWAIKGITREIK